MKLKTVFKLILISVFLVSCNQTEDYRRIEGFAQGGTYSIIYRCPKGCDHQALSQTIDNLLLAIDNSVSGYNKGSLLSRINHGEDLPLDSIFTSCFIRSKEIWAESDGAFDPSAAPLFDLWGFGFEDRSQISDAAIDSILAFVGMDKLSLEQRNDGLHLLKADERIKLNFNAIAQGYSCDAVAAILENAGCHDYLIDVGREMMCRGQRKGGGPWHIGIDKPVDGDGSTLTVQDVVDVSDKGIVTSGNYHKFYIKDGRKYAHTIDPRSGRPVEHNLLSATVTAKDATTADAIATWFMVVGLDEAAAIASSRDDLWACLIYSEGDDMKIWKKQ